MTKNKPIVPDTEEVATEADLCSVVEGEQSVLLSGPETGWREDEVRSAAYALYEARKGLDGSAEEDWLQAEAQIAQIASAGV